MTPTRLPNGSITPSIASAARILGVCEGTIRAHLDRNGDLNSVGETARRKITFEGVTYPSVSECARVTGLTRAAIYRALGESPARTRSARHQLAAAMRLPEIKALVAAAKPFAQVRIKDGVSQAGDIGRTDVTNIRAALAAWAAYERSKHT